MHTMDLFCLLSPATTINLTVLQKLLQHSSCVIPLELGVEQCSIQTGTACFLLVPKAGLKSSQLLHLKMELTCVWQLKFPTITIHLKTVVLLIWFNILLIIFPNYIVNNMILLQSVQSSYYQNLDTRIPCFSFPFMFILLHFT